MGLLLKMETGGHLSSSGLIHPNAPQTEIASRLRCDIKDDTGIDASTIKRNQKKALMLSFK